MAGREREAGDVLDGRYRLVERLGQGGFGDVWRAEELLPDGKPLREVAIKLLVRGVASDWAEEARIIASLRHPALVTIYAAGIVAVDDVPTPFVAMELLRGENLANLVGAGQTVVWRRALAWARETAAALDEIHRAGVVHLDLKPANLFLTAAGLKVLDFGISKKGAEREAIEAGGDDSMSTAAFMAQDGGAAGASASHTGTSRTVVGTPGFMAPEVIEGGEATPAADAYALAACVVQLVTGQLPQNVRVRPDSSQRTEQQHWVAEVQAATLHGRMRELDPEAFPRGFAELLARWLRLDPVARSVGAGSLSAELEEVWVRPHGATRSPFSGTAALGAEHEGNLWGRERECERLSRELVDQPCLLLQGPAGAGLTSLALAGVVPSLAKRGADGCEEFLSCVVRLGEDPDGALDAALSHFLAKHAPRADLLHASKDGPTLDLEQRLERWGATTNVGVALVVEDFASALVHVSRAEKFWRLVARLVRGVRGVRMLGLLREERLGALLAHETAQSLQAFVRFIGLPSWSVAEELVHEPARAAGIRIEGADDVVRAVKAELARPGGSLAAVSLALGAWWRGPLSLARWNEQGGLEGPLAEHAEGTLSAMPRERGVVAEWLCLRLVRADGSPEEVDANSLTDAHEDADLAALVLDELRLARLVSVRANKVSLAHPSLATEWRRLHDRRLHDIERMTFVEELRSAAHRYRQSGSASSDLWGGARIAELDRRFPGVVRELGPEDRDFIEASRRARKRGRILRALGVALGVAAVFGGLALEKVRRARVDHQRAQLDEANRQAAVERLVTSSRRTVDPYRRVALLGAAMDAGSTDPLLGFELLASTRDLPPAKFLSLDPPLEPRFPWDGRVLLGHTREHVVLLDLLPDEGAQWGAVETRIAAHDEGVYDVEPFRFGNGFVTRGLDGSLRVWKSRENRQVALAAVSPMKCLCGLSPVLVAAAAPVVACMTSDGLARWDLRDAGRVDTVAFGGRLLALSPDGEWLAAARQDRLMVQRRGQEGSELAMPERRAAMLGAFSPRDPVLAVLDGRSVFAFEMGSGTPRPLFKGRPLDHGVDEPVTARFAEGGLDLSVCNAEGDGRSTYLRKGGRAEGDGPAPKPDAACRADAPSPEALASLGDYGDTILKAASLGPRRFDGGYRLADGRLLTRDLVAFDPNDRRLAEVTVVGSEDAPPSGRSLTGVVRTSDLVAMQYGDELRGLTVRGETRFVRAAQLLGACADGRVLAWRKSEDGARYEVLDAASDVVVGRIVRNPGFMLGAEPSCHRVFVQLLDGRVASAVLGGPASAVIEPVPIEPGDVGFTLEGYVFDVRPSAASEEGDAGLWLAFSSGALARASASGTLRPYGNASPRATAMADGRTPGELLFADESGIVLRSRGEQDRRVLGPTAERQWSDLRVLPGRKRALAAWVNGLALVDLERAEMLGWTELGGRGRLAAWDEEGSVLSWSFANQGPPLANLVPLGRTLAKAVAERASNLLADLDPNGAPRVTLR
jgi:hypothetical protein